MFDPTRASDTAERLRNGTPALPIVVSEQPPSRLEQLRERRDSWYKIDGPRWLLKEKNRILPEIIRAIEKLEKEENNG